MSSPTIRVLYIDDEEENLEGFSASFRRAYEMYTATSAAEGLKILENIDIDVIFCDQRMPQVTGVEFFKSIIEKYPNPIRILITGFTDVKELADAVNDGHIYRYITKPWESLDIHNAIKNGYDSYKAKIDLKNKVMELEKTNDELNRFIYSMSHELRSPLVSILGIVNLIKLENQHDVNQHYWNLVETCSNKLDYYIQRTIQYYKNSKELADNDEVDFQELVFQLVSLYGYSDKETKFNVSIKQDVKFLGDIFRIEVVLGNLISNAIKYQKVGGLNKKVEINVKVDDQQAEIIISDNGIGILKDHLEKIFTQFFKSKVQHGSGLGLFIVKEALIKLNGKISVSSDNENGTTFKITIPNGE